MRKFRKDRTTAAVDLRRLMKLAPVAWGIVIVYVAACSSAASIGPFEIHTADSSAVLSLRMAAQLRMDWENKDGGIQSDRSSTLSMQARRIRPSVAVDLPKQRLRFYLHLSTAPGSLELMDLYFDYRLGRSFQLRAGQYKTPFTRYRIQSYQRLTFVDWAVVTKYFGAERQMGFTIHNGYENPSRWGYAAGVFSGVNARASHAVGLATIYGEPSVNPSDLSDPGPKARFHPELFGHVSFNTGGIDVRSDSDEKSQGWRSSFAASLSWDLDPDQYQDLALRLAPEMLLKHRGVSFMAAGYIGFVPIANSLRTRLAMTGLLAQSSLRLTDRYEVSLRYAVVDMEEAVLNDAFLRAARLVNAAQEQLSDSTLTQEEFNDLKKRYRDAGRTKREQELTAGCNIYLQGHSLKWQSDVGWLRRTIREGEAMNDITVRSQLQLAF